MSFSSFQVYGDDDDDDDDDDDNNDDDDDNNDDDDDDDGNNDRCRDKKRLRVILNRLNNLIKNLFFPELIFIHLF